MLQLNVTAAYRLPHSRLCAEPTATSTALLRCSGRRLDVPVPVRGSKEEEEGQPLPSWANGMRISMTDTHSLPLLPCYLGTLPLVAEADERAPPAVSLS